MVDLNGNRVAHQKLDCKLDDVLEFFERYRQRLDTLAVESTFNWYWLVDGLGWRRWTAPFLWVGANPILLYVCSGLGFFRLVADRLVSASSKEWACLPACVSFALMLLLARWLWRRGLFIKV